MGGGRFSCCVAKHFQITYCSCSANGLFCMLFAKLSHEYPVTKRRGAITAHELKLLGVSRKCDPNLVISGESVSL